MFGLPLLLKYLPPQSHEYVAFVVKTYPAHVHISSQRISKLGDFRPSSHGRLHRISINHNLNPYAFLITLMHEYAHLLNWERHRNKVKPHGQEWKQEFKNLMHPLMNRSVFPETILNALHKYMSNPAASSCADKTLMLALRTFDQEQKHYLCDLEQDAVFRLSSGKMFIRKEKRRKFYTCIELHSGKKYLVNELAEVELFNMASSDAIKK